MILSFGDIAACSQRLVDLKMSTYCKNSLYNIPQSGLSIFFRVLIYLFSEVIVVFRNAEKNILSITIEKYNLVQSC